MKMTNYEKLMRHQYSKDEFVSVLMEYNKGIKDWLEEETEEITLADVIIELEKKQDIPKFEEEIDFTEVFGYLFGEKR